MALGNRIKIARKRRGLTQSKLARLSGTLQATISALERYDRKTAQRSTEIAQALGVRLEWLLTGEGSMDPVSPSTPNDDVDALISRSDLFRQLSAAYKEIARLEHEINTLKNSQNTQEKKDP